jgi:Magnesium chelatase, subunit ChlI C-terminal
VCQNLWCEKGCRFRPLLSADRGTRMKVPSLTSNRSTKRSNLIRERPFTLSFYLQGHPLAMSNMTRVNNQFPRPHLHRLDRQPYRLQTTDGHARKLSGYRCVKDEAEKLLETAINRLGLSARAYSRVLNIGCTIADSHTAEPFSTEAWTGECGHAPGRFDVYLKSDESQFRWARLSQLNHGVVQKPLRKWRLNRALCHR